MPSSTFDRETISSLAQRLDRLAPEFSDAERSQLITLLIVASAEIAGRSGIEPDEPEVEPFDMTADGFSNALGPLIVTTAIGMSQAGGGPTPPNTTTPSPSGASGTGKKKP